ncbi:MAG: sensor domain-containing diguanylate cyclase [Pseudomonadota bacterium]
MDQVLAQLSDTIASAATLEDLTRPMLEMLEAVTGCESTYLTSVDLDGGIQHVILARNARGDGLQIPEGLSVPWADTLCKRALDEGRPYTSNVAECWGDSAAARELGIRTYVSAPVRTDDGHLYGTLCAASVTEVPLRLDAQHVLQLFSRLIGQHVERERLVAQLRSANALLSASTRTDTLTELPNRRSLMEELQAMLARGARADESVLVAFIDLDGFKAINDMHGHECGDGFLRAMAKSLSTALRKGDLLARLGGDEFVVVGPGPALGEDATAAADALARRLGDCTIGDVTVGSILIPYAGASVGVVAVDPRRCGADQALRLADAAMYAVKRQRASTRH